MLETRVLYAGGSLAPVSLAFDPRERSPFLSQLTQDQVFAALLSKTHQSSQA